MKVVPVIMALREDNGITFYTLEIGNIGKIGNITTTFY